MKTFDPVWGEQQARALVAEFNGLQTGRILFTRPGSVPKTTSGKVQRQKCKQLYSSGELTGLTPAKRAVQKPTSAVGEHLIAAVARAAGVPQASIDPEASLFSLGLDSRMAIDLQAALETQTGHTLPLDWLLSGPSIADIVRRLPQTTQSAPAPTSTAEGNAEKVRSLNANQEALWFLSRLAPDSAAFQLHLAFHIEGPLKTETLVRILPGLMTRHPGLRTCFSEQNGTPRLGL